MENISNDKYKHVHYPSRQNINNGKAVILHACFATHFGNSFCSSANTEFNKSITFCGKAPKSTRSPCCIFKLKVTYLNM